MSISKFALQIALSIVLILGGTSRVCQALVEPEIEAWQKLIEQTRSTLPSFGSSIVLDALEGVGQFGSGVASAPLSELMTELEQRRQLKFKYFTPWHVKDKATLGLFMKEALERDYTPQKIYEEESLLKALGLVPLDFKLVAFLEKLLTDAVGGAYDPLTDQFFLVDTNRGQSLKTKFMNKASTAILGDSSTALIIHELDHALGGQHFPLKESLERISKTATLDQQLALMSLVEGDAMFVMIDHQQKQPPEKAGADTLFVGSDFMVDMLLSIPLPLPGMGEFSEAPLFFQRSLIFPYLGGAEFVSTIRQGDWSDVNDCYSSLPSSTEQIFHPLRYRYLVRKPEIPDFSSLPEPFGEWEKIVDQVGGEFLIRIVLEQYGVENYRSAADGWHGDKIRVFRNKKSGGLGFYWVIRWDNTIDAEEFYASLGSHLPFVIQQEETLTAISLAFTQSELAQLRKRIKPLPKAATEPKPNTDE